ncbi:MAG: hypothetical protein ACM30H_10140 [Clostridia bacterium]
MSEPQGITRFDFASGELRGTELTLYPACLVHRGAGYLETLPLRGVASVRVEFLRDRSRLGWGAAWLAIALVLLAAAPILAALATAATQELATQNAAAGGGVGGALVAFFRFLERFADVLPFLAALAAIVGAALCALGWIGSTTLTVAFAGGERSFPVRGRNALLLAFSERVSEQVVATLHPGK